MESIERKLKKVLALNLNCDTFLKTLFDRKKEQLLREMDIRKIDKFLEEATDEEVLSLLMQKSLEAPIHDEYVSIMAYLLEKILGDDMPKDLRLNRDLNYEEETLLKDLKINIRKQQIKVINRAIKKRKER